MKYYCSEVDDVLTETHSTRDGLTAAEAAKRLERVLWNDPGTGVMRHADAGYDIAIDCAREKGLDLPSL